MAKLFDVGWDSLDVVRPDAAIDAKRSIDRADAERVGVEPDWRLKVAQIRERREDEFLAM